MKPFELHTERVYQFAQNELVAAQGSDVNTVRAVFLRLKNKLIGFSSNPWTVLGSSNGSTAGLDGVDRLTANSSIVYAAAPSPHSWIVLRQPGTGMQVLFDWSYNTAPEYAYVWASLVGFSGGSITAAPTAADKQQITNDTTVTPYWIKDRTNAQYVLHLLHSADGKQTVVFIYKGGIAQSFYVFAEAKSAVPGWTTPYVAAGGAYGLDGWIDQFDMLYGNTNRIKSWQGSNLITFCATAHTSYAMGTTPACRDFNGVDPLTGKYRTQPIGLVSRTVGYRGRHGRLADIWFTSAAAANGYYPGRTDYAVCGDYVIPWGAGSPVFS